MLWIKCWCVLRDNLIWSLFRNWPFRASSALWPLHPSSQEYTHRNTHFFPSLAISIHLKIGNSISGVSHRGAFPLSESQPHSQSGVERLCKFGMEMHGMEMLLWPHPSIICLNQTRPEIKLLKCKGIFNYFFPPVSLPLLFFCKWKSSTLCGIQSPTHSVRTLDSN